MSGHGETTEPLTLVNIEGPVVIQAPKIVVRLPEGEFKSQLEKLSSQPGQEWLLQLADRPDVDWQQVALAHEKWEYQHSGLTAEAALVIVIVVAVLTQGAGASLAGATSTTGVAVANAGFSFLASQATLSLINNKGDLGKTLSDLGSSETVKGLVATLLTAGLTAGVTQALQLPNPATNTAFLDRFTTYATQAAVRAGVQSAVYGTPLDESAKAALTAALAQALTAEIGDWGVENDIENGALSKALAHASVQCAAALIGGGDCGAAAIGGFAAELLSPLAEQSGKWGTLVTATGSILAAKLLGADSVTAAGAGMMVDGYNRRLHQDQRQLLLRQSAGDAAKYQRALAVLCVMQNCAQDGLAGDTTDPESQALMAQGLALKQSNPQLFAQVQRDVLASGALSGANSYGLKAYLSDKIGSVTRGYLTSQEFVDAMAQFNTAVTLQEGLAPITGLASVARGPVSVATSVERSVGAKGVGGAVEDANFAQSTIRTSEAFSSQP